MLEGGCVPRQAGATAGSHGWFALSCAAPPETCPFSHPWPSLGIQGPPGKGNAILPLRTQRDAGMFFVAAGTEHHPGLPFVPRAGLRLSHTWHTCTAVDP